MLRVVTIGGLIAVGSLIAYQTVRTRRADRERLVLAIGAGLEFGMILGSVLAGAIMFLETGNPQFVPQFAW